MKLSGTAVLVGAHIDTDLLFPSEAIVTMSQFPRNSAAYHQALLTYGFKNLEIDKTALGTATFIVAGAGFGAGSSRQYAVEVLKAYHIKGVLAESIHPIFFRNLWNLGMVALEIRGITQSVCNGDTLHVDLVEGTVRTSTHQTLHLLPALPAWLLAILDAGGLLPFWIGKA